MNERIIELLEKKQYGILRREMEDYNAVDLAEIIDELDETNAVIVFRLLHKDQAADVFSYLSAQQRKNIVDVMSETRLQGIIEEMFFDDLIDFLEEMPASVVKRLVKTSSEEERRLINQFLNYPERSAGSIMTIEHVSLNREMTVDQALAHIRRTGPDKETIYTCYVLDDHRKLEGIVSLRRLVLAESAEKISDLMDESFVSVTTLTDQEEVAQLVRKYDLISIPVVDLENRLVGIITVDDIMDVVEQESTEDFQRMAAMVPDNEEYMFSSPVSLARKRIPWLLILMISATFTATIIGHFEGLLSTMVILTASIPMLMNTAGNAGSQSSTLIIRGLATGEIETGDYLKVFWKEFRISLMVGSILATVNFVRMLLFGNPTLVSLTVSLTLILTVMLAEVIGGGLPLLAKRMKLDPAIMAGPVITTIVDGISLMVYFSIAVRLMGL